jgi:alpha-L-fucosidase 2
MSLSSNDDNDNPDAPKYIDEIRALLFAGKFKEATELTNKTQVCKGVGSGIPPSFLFTPGSFQNLIRRYRVPTRKNSMVQRV